jgi:hypothetical protein
MADILAYGPCQSMEEDTILIEVGLARFYDDDPEYIEATPWAENSLYEMPLYRVRDCWRSDEEPPAPDVNVNCNVANRPQTFYGSQAAPGSRSFSYN